MLSHTTVANRQKRKFAHLFRVVLLAPGVVLPLVLRVTLVSRSVALLVPIVVPTLVLLDAPWLLRAVMLVAPVLLRAMLLVPIVVRTPMHLYW